MIQHFLNMSKRDHQLNVADPPPPPLFRCARDTRTVKQCSFNVGQRWTLDQQLH